VHGSCFLHIHLVSEKYSDQSNLAKGGIAVASPPNSSFVFARWQHRTDGLAAICNCMFWLGVRPPNISLLLGVRKHHLTQCVIGPHKCACQTASASVKRSKQCAVHECDRRQTDRPHYKEMCRSRRNRLLCKTRFRLIYGNFATLSRIIEQVMAVECEYVKVP